MKVITTPIDGLLLFEPKVYGDERGFFVETYQIERYLANGLDARFVQDNQSRSSKGILRGLHFQNPHGQGKLVRAARGSVLDVAVDIRVGSPTFGQHFSTILDDTAHRQLYIPPGFAHGFCVLSETADFCYKCTELYHPENEGTILWNDPQLNIDWPTENPILSEKDNAALTLASFPTDRLPKM